MAFPPRVAPAAAQRRAAGSVEEAEAEAETKAHRDRRAVVAVVALPGGAGAAVGPERAAVPAVAVGDVSDVGVVGVVGVVVDGVVDHRAVVAAVVDVVGSTPHITA